MRPRPTVAILVALVMALATATGASADHRSRWSTTWTAVHHHPFPSYPWAGPNWSMDGFTDQSLRQVVRVSTGGEQVRIRLTNRYGTTPLRVTGATIAKAGQGAALRRGTVRTLTFGGACDTTIPAGADTTSDPVDLPVAPLDSLAVTLYFDGSTGPATFHLSGLATTYRAAGDHRFTQDHAPFASENVSNWYYLTGVEVAGRSTGAVATFGDSITDGVASTPNANNRYPDELAERLVIAGRPLSVHNAGISGNRLLADSTCFGEKGVDRFRRDVLDRPDVRTAIVLLGINDIVFGGQADFGCGASPRVTPEDLIAGYRELIRAAKARGVKIIGSTLLPLKGSSYDTPCGGPTPCNEQIRDAVNDWIRTSGEFDAVVDLDRALADPADPDALRPAYASPDRIHPNDAGMTAMAAAIDLAIL